MRSSLLILLSPLAAYGLNRVAVDFDKSLEGRVGTYEKVEEVVGRFSNKAQGRKPKRSLDQANVDVGSLFARAPHASSHSSLQERYLTCDPGYGLCRDFSGCCPTDNNCCSYGYCIEPNYKCCPTGPCEPNEGCCGTSHCYPIGGECCRDETSCTPGNRCYKHPSYSGSVCCTDSKCTASVDDTGSTTYASTSTTTRTLTTTRTQAYYWTVTYWYWYYYWSVSIEIDASIVTSSRRTSTTVFSVQTTDADAASSYFEELSDTLELPTPAEATSLESLAGKTSYEDQPTETSEPEPEPTSSTTSEEPSSEEPSSEEPSSEEPTESTSTEETVAPSEEPSTTPPSSEESTTAADTSSSPTNVPSKAARALWSGVDSFTVGFVTIGFGIGVVAVLL